MLAVDETASNIGVFELSAPHTVLGVTGRKRFIAVAPNGGRRTAADHPKVPITAEQLAQAARACLDAGAAMMHVHVRDRNSNHLLDVEAYRDATRAIRAQCGENLIIQITTEALNKYEPWQQRQIVYDVVPEAASLGFREFVKDEKSAEDFAKLLGWMKSEGVAAQIIIYDTDDLDRLCNFVRRFGLAFSEISLLLVLGRYSTSPNGGMSQLLSFLTYKLPAVRDLMVCAFGAEEVANVTGAALFRSNVRVGFENSLWVPNGDVADDNAAIVGAANAALKSVGFEIGSADELRSVWGIG